MRLKQLKRQLFEIRTEIALTLNDKQKLKEEEKILLDEIKKEIKNSEGNKIK